MRRSMSAICSGAAERNSGITSTVCSEATIAATTQKYTAKRPRRSAGVKRRHSLSSAALTR
jgi:hypothetical protein